MKIKYTISLSILMLCNLAIGSELILADGMHPFTIDDRVTFFAQNNKTSGKVEWSIITANCTSMTQKRTVTEISTDGGLTSTQVFKNDESITNNLREQEFVKLDSDIVHIVRRLCADIK